MKKVLLNGLFQLFTFSLVTTYDVHDESHSHEGPQRYFLAGPRDYNYNRSPSENHRFLSDKSLLHKAFFASPAELVMESSPSISDSFYVHPPQDASSIGSMTIPVIPSKGEKNERKFYNHISRPSKAKDFFSRYNKRVSSTTTETPEKTENQQFVPMGSSSEEASNENFETPKPELETSTIPIKEDKEKDAFVYEGTMEIKDILKSKLKENSTSQKLSGYINGKEFENKGTSLVIKIPYKNMQESVEIFDQKTEEYSKQNVFQLPLIPQNSPNLKVDEKGEIAKKDEAAIIEILTGPDNLKDDPESDPKFWESLYREYLLEQQKISASKKKPQRVGTLASGKGPMRVKIHIFKGDGSEEDVSIEGDALQSKKTELRVKTTTTVKPAVKKFERKPSKRVFSPVIPSPKRVETSRESIEEEDGNNERYMQSNEPRHNIYDYHNQNYEDYQRGSGW